MTGATRWAVPGARFVEVEPDGGARALLDGALVRIGGQGQVTGAAPESLWRDGITLDLWVGIDVAGALFAARSEPQTPPAFRFDVGGLMAPDMFAPAETKPETCGYPPGEITVDRPEDAWGSFYSSPGVYVFGHAFTQLLIAPASWPFFVGREVYEVTGPTKDECHFENPRFPRVDRLSYEGSPWVVGADNSWGQDWVMMRSDAIAFYRVERPLRGLPMPCVTRIQQIMQMTSCDGSTRSSYWKGRNNFVIGADFVEVQRGATIRRIQF